MLDAFIIEKIREDRERRESGLQPLRIEVPRPAPPAWSEREEPDRKRKDEDADRGVVIIDFNI